LQNPRQEEAAREREAAEEAPGAGGAASGRAGSAPLPAPPPGAPAAPAAPAGAPGAGGRLAPQVRLGAGGEIELVEESLTVMAQQQELDSFTRVSDAVRCLLGAAVWGCSVGPRSGRARDGQGVAGRPGRALGRAPWGLVADACSSPPQGRTINSMTYGRQRNNDRWDRWGVGTRRAGDAGPARLLRPGRRRELFPPPRPSATFTPTHAHPP
jgi:hypothetical protein